MAHNIFASFPSAEAAEKALGALLDHGVRSEDISVIFNRPGEVGEVDGGKTIDIREHAEKGITTTTPEDAAAGAGSGAAIGLGIGALAGLASLAIPGVGLVVGGGALATALMGALGTSVAGAVAGGTMGFLKDQGVPEHMASTYSEHLEGGGAVLAVTVPSNAILAPEVATVLAKYGGSQIESYGHVNSMHEPDVLVGGRL